MFEKPSGCELKLSDIHKHPAANIAVLVGCAFTSDGPPEDLAWRPEVVRTAARVCVHPLAQKLLVLHYNQRSRQGERDTSRLSSLQHTQRTGSLQNALLP